MVTLVVVKELFFNIYDVVPSAGQAVTFTVDKWNFLTLM